MASPDIVVPVVAGLVLVAFLLFIRVQIWAGRCFAARRQRDQARAERDALRQQLDYYHRITDVTTATRYAIWRAAR